MQNGTPNGTHNGQQNGMQDDEIPNDTDNGVHNGTQNATQNATQNSMQNVLVNGVPTEGELTKVSQTGELGLPNLVARLRLLYEHNNPMSKELWQRACQILPGGSTRSVLYHPPFPITMRFGRYCYVTSLDEDEYLDFVSEYSAGLFGHTHNEIKRTVNDVLHDGINLGGNSEQEVRFAEHIADRFKSMHLLRFCNSGTEANTLALGVATNFTKRSKILAFKQGYHGGTLTFAHDNNPMNLPYEYVLGEFNDIDQTKRVLTDDIAAILVEPMQGAGGYILATQEFLFFLRQLATDIGAVLIFDEIVTSRLHYHGMQEHFGVYPDMTTLGKYIGGGFPIGVFGGREDIMQQLDPRLTRPEGGLSISGTFNNNAFSIRCGLAATKMISPLSIARLNTLGDMLRQGFQDLLTDNSVNDMQLTGFGSLIGIHFTGEDPELRRETFYLFMLYRRIYIVPRGAFILNFMHNEEHVLHALRAIKEYLLIPLA